MKAYLYEERKNGKDYICAKFDNNSNERVTIFHANGGIYQQYWQPGEVVYEPKEGNIRDQFVNDYSFELSKNEVGDIINHVWRPGLCLDIAKALDIDDGEKARAKRELKILVERLHEILLYIEPDSACLSVYGHKIRELLILACTECESLWINYIRLAGNTNPRLTTNDYVKLKDKLFLSEYNVIFTSHPIKHSFQPFKEWDSHDPTQSLPWYDGYNKTKHNIAEHFSKASLENCINAIAANIIMFCVRYSPYALIEEHDLCSNLVNEYFSVELLNPDISSFYIPPIKSFPTATGAFSGPLASALEREWNIKPFLL